MKVDSHAARAFEEIRKKILSNQLHAGLRLKEDEWAKKIGVSRITIREALTRLLGEGLVIHGEKGGFYVRGLVASEVHAIRELREVLELGALRLMYRKAKKGDFEKLEKICDDFTHMVKQGYLNGALEADMKFHEMLIEMSGNEKLKQVYMSSHIPLFHQKLGKTQNDINDYEQTDTEHRLIVKSLKERKLNVAEETLIRHFARGEAVVMDLS